MSIPYANVDPYMSCVHLPIREKGLGRPFPSWTMKSTCVYQRVTLLGLALMDSHVLPWSPWITHGAMSMPTERHDLRERSTLQREARNPNGFENT